MKNYIFSKLFKLKIFVYNLERLYILQFLFGFNIGCISFEQNLLIIVLFIVLIFLTFKFRIFLFILVCFVLGIIYSCLWINKNNFQTRNFDNTFFEDNGFIVEEPKIGFSQQLVIKTQKLQGLIIIKTTNNFKYHFNDHVKIAGYLKLTKLDNSSIYSNYLINNKIYYEITKAEVKLIDYNNIFNIVNSISLNVNNKIKKIFNPPYSSLIIALTLGDHQLLPQNILEQFYDLQISYLINFSSYNFILLISLIYSLNKKFHRKTILVFNILVTIFIFLLTYIYQPLNLKIFIILVLLFLSEIIGRKINKLIIINIILFILLTDYPLYYNNISVVFFLISNVSYFLLYNFIKNFLYKITKKKEFSITMALNISLSFLTYPLSSYLFGKVSLLNIPTSIVINPTFNIIKLLSLISIIFSYFAPMSYINKFIVTIVEKFLDLVLKFINVLSLQRWANINNTSVICLIILIIFIFVSYDYYSFTKQNVMLV